MSCEVASPDVIDIGIRIAIYSYAGCSAVLGFLTLVGAGQRRLIQDEDDRERYTELVTKHISDVNYAVETSTLTGVALIMAALWHQHQYHGLTLFHAYIVILLLWVITLTGMWFVIHAWVFDILRRNKRRMSTSSFWKQILKKSHWFTIQFSLMGGYGLYVTIRRNDFLSPDCGLPFFKDKVWSSFLFGFSAAPIVNSCMLFIITSSLVWLASVIVVYSRKGWAGQVDPVVFCVFWLLEYVIMLGGLIATIETSITRYTSGGESKSPFGSTLAIALVVVPARLVILRAWQLISHQEDEATSNGEKLPIVSHHKPGGSKEEKFTLVLPHKPGKSLSRLLAMSNPNHVHPIAPTSRIRLPSTRSVAPSRPPQGATKRNHKPPPYRHREFKALVVTQ